MERIVVEIQLKVFDYSEYFETTIPIAQYTLTKFCEFPLVPRQKDTIELAVGEESFSFIVKVVRLQEEDETPLLIVERDTFASSLLQILDKLRSHGWLILEGAKPNHVEYLLADV